MSCTYTSLSRAEFLGYFDIPVLLRAVGFAQPAIVEGVNSVVDIQGECTYLSPPKQLAA